jgi:hypothetical protein
VRHRTDEACRALAKSVPALETRMNTQNDLEGLILRLDQAQTDCEAWRASGPREKCLEAYFLVEALTLQADACLKQINSETA